MTPRVLALALAVLLPVSHLASAQQMPQASTARITGRVVTETGTIVRRAIVTVGGDLPRSRSVVSDDNGAFLFDALPAGRFAVSATRDGFIAAAYGAKAPGQPGTRLSVAAGETATAVLVMSRGAVVTGTVRSDTGEPVVGVQVAVLPARASTATTTSSTAVNTVSTDDRGIYRAFGLASGSYFVAAYMPLRGNSPSQIEMLSVAQMDEAFRRAQQTAARGGTLISAGSAIQTRQAAPDTPSAVMPKYGYAPIFYPGTADGAGASTLTLSSGEERSGIDLVLMPTPAVAIDGEVVSPNGPLTRVEVSLAPDASIPSIPGLRQVPTLAIQPVTLPTPSGRFRFVGVSPGRYTIAVRTIGGQVTAGPGGEIQSIRQAAPGEPAAPNLWASADLVVTRDDLTGVVLSLRPAPRMAGRVAFDGASTAAPANLTAIRVSATRLNTRSDDTIGINGVIFGPMLVPSATVREDGTFDTPVFPGTFRLTSTRLTGGWWLRSAISGGRDLLDDPLVVASDDGELPPVVVTYSDRHTDVRGTLQTPAGAPAPGYFIVVFTAERRWWLPDGRRLAVARPATDGQFSVRDLPPGDYYIAALTDLDADTWRSPDFLDQVVPAALRLTIGEGETKTQDLQIAR